MLCVEIQQLIQEVKVFAKSAASSFRDMAERCEVDELTGLSEALWWLQNKARTFHIRSSSRLCGQKKIEEKSEEEAAKVPVKKMVPVIMLFIMPLILAPMLGQSIVVIVNAIKPILAP